MSMEYSARLVSVKSLSTAVDLQYNNIKLYESRPVSDDTDAVKSPGLGQLSHTQPHSTVASILNYTVS